MSTGRWITALGAVALVSVVVLAWPDTSDSPSTSTTSVPSTSAEDTLAPDPTLQALPGRLLVIDGDGRISTMRPDGTDRVTVAPADGSLARRSLPVWSPDGDRITWAQRFTDERIELVVASATGETLSVLEPPFVPTYVAWDPTGRLIAFSGDDGRANQVLVVVDLATAEMTKLAEGAPVYFDWSRDGEMLLVHTAENLEFIAADGSARSSIDTDGDFRVPVQLNDSLVIGFGREVGHVLTIASAEGAVELEMIRYATPMAFTVGGSGRIAILSKGSADNQRLSAEPITDLEILEPNNLKVIDSSTGGITHVAEARGVAWFFSPDGDQLAYITEETVDTVQRLQWHLWDGSRIIDMAIFSPAGRFGRDYLAFFDQFSRTTSLWAPDGSAFAYVGGTSTDDLGVWIQRVDSAEPIRVSGGAVAVWSPAAANSDPQLDSP